MKWIKYSSIVILCLLLQVSCKKDSQIESDVSKIDVAITIERFDKLFAETTVESLPKLKETYPFMFSKNTADSVWIGRLNDTLQQQLSQETQKAFKSEVALQSDLEQLFQHLKYYFKTYREPRIITVTNNVRYRDKTIVTDSIVLIALDTYLGTEHEFYDNIPNYLKQNFRSSQIVVDLAESYSDKYIYQPKRKTLLDEMIYHGKQLYFKEKIIPFVTDAEKIGYTQKQIDWSLANESYIWRYFIERELLYSTDSKLPTRFINPGPFSKFYLEEIDNESPGRIGRYIGWQIVRAYMKNNDTTFKDMLQMDAEEIFKNSKFKPKK